MNVLAKGKQVYFVLAAVTFFSGCGTVYVHESDRDLTAAARRSFSVEASVDSAYRRVYAHLRECVSRYGYRVRGDINRERTAADITVDSGVGFHRTLYLADSIFLKAELERLAPGATRVTLIIPSEGARTFADAARRSLESGGEACRA